MTTTEKRNAIVAKCRELLAIAEKRTSGTWEADDNWIGKSHSAVAMTYHYANEADAAYIAACAGAAEAGWRSTIAAILALQEIEENGFCHCDKVIADILSAWEGLV